MTLIAGEDSDPGLVYIGQDGKAYMTRPWYDIRHADNSGGYLLPPDTPGILVNAAKEIVEDYNRGVDPPTIVTAPTEV
jgi:hypothetical protein